jgi:hypothetical protein
MVRILVMMNNQQVTNSKLDLVGTSETLRIVSFLIIITFPNSNDNKRFNE